MLTRIKPMNRKMVFKICLNGFYFICFVSVVLADESPCSPENRANDMDNCLLKVKAQLFNKTAYWFGNQYSVDCPQGAVQGNIFCDNPRSGEEDSLATRLFPAQLNLELIDRYLEVTYSTGSGFYSGCGVDEAGPSFQRSIDPLANDLVTPWDTRQHPDFRFNSTTGEYYTVIFYDVGFLVPHAVYVNVQGNTVLEGNAVKQYHGPLNALLRVNPYIFLVFKQTNQITVSQQWIDIINTSANGGFLIPDFASEYSLIGPIAVSWMPVTGDLYSAGLAESRQSMFTCPLFVSRALETDFDQLSFLDPPLSVAVNVVFQSPEFSYTLCCSNPHTKFQAQNLTVDPFSNKTVFSGYVRSNASLSISFRKVGYYRDSDRFADELYTLLVVDPDVPSASVGSRDRPLLHYMVVNIRNGDLSTGNEVVSYIGPQPPDSTAHRYYFLLYKQQKQLVATHMPSYAGSCPSTDLTLRCLYNVNQLAYDEKLTLVGANVLRATYDDYVRYQRIDQSDSSAVAEACKTVPAFSDPCSGSASIYSLSRYIIALFLCFVIVVF